MAQDSPPLRIANDSGAKEIRIGTKRFTCIGASAPFDHPHIYLQMGKKSEMVCPYCSTRFIYDEDCSTGQKSGERI